MRSLSQLLRSAFGPVFGGKRSTRRLRSRISTTAAMVEICEHRELLTVFSVGELDFNGTQFDRPTVEDGGTITSTNTSDEYVFNFDSDTGPSRAKAVVWGMTANVNLFLIGPAPGSSVIATSILPGTASDGVFSNELVPGV